MRCRGYYCNPKYMPVYVLTSDARTRLDLHRTKEYFHSRKQVGSIGKLNAVNVTMRPTAVLPHQAVPALLATSWDNGKHQERRKDELGLRRYQKTNHRKQVCNCQSLEEAVNIVNLW